MAASSRYTRGFATQHCSLVYRNPPLLSSLWEEPDSLSVLVELVQVRVRVAQALPRLLVTCLRSPASAVPPLPHNRCHLYHRLLT